MPNQEVFWFFIEDGYQYAYIQTTLLDLAKYLLKPGAYKRVKV